MNKIKRILAAVLTLAIMLSLTACGDTSWIIKVDGEPINSGLYIYYQSEGYSAAGYELAQTDQNYLYYMMYGYSYFEDKVGDQTVEEYMNEYALDMCKQYVAVEKLFDELGLELSDEQVSLIESQVRRQWDASSATLTKIGVSKDTLKKVLTTSTKSSMVFDKYFEVGGLNGTTEDDIKGYLEDNYARIKYMTFNFADSADDAIDEARKNEALALAQSYLDRANAGEAMNDLIAEYNASLEEENEDAEDSADDNADDIEDENTENLDASEEDEYLNENIISKTSTYPSEKFANYVFENVKTGTFSLVQDDVNIYLVEKLDVLERTEIYDENRSTFLNALFDSDYTALLNKRVQEYNIEVNNNSVKRYKAKKSLGLDD